METLHRVRRLHRYLAPVLLALLAGCSPGRFEAAVTPEQAMADEAQCHNTAEALTWGYEGLQLAARYNRVYDNCMIGRGYRRVD